MFGIIHTFETMSVGWLIFNAGIIVAAIIGFGIYFTNKK
jgi:hypothetical protein